jgi:hypothetical protein
VPRYLAHALDALGEPCTVVPARVAEVVVIDHELVTGTRPKGGRLNRSAGIFVSCHRNAHHFVTIAGEAI